MRSPYTLKKPFARTQQYRAFWFCFPFWLGFLIFPACNSGPAISIKMQVSQGTTSPCLSQGESAVQAIRVELESNSFQTTNPTLTSLEAGADLIKNPNQSVLGFQGPALQKILRHCAVELGYVTPELRLNKVTVTLFGKDRLPSFCAEKSGTLDPQTPLELTLISCKDSPLPCCKQ